MARLFVLSALVLSTATSLAAQQQAPLTRANWALADRYTNDALQPMVYTASVNARFIGKSDSLWYQWKDRDGTRFMLVVPALRSKTPLFDHKKLAAALTAGGRPYDANSLPFTNIDVPRKRPSQVQVSDRQHTLRVGHALGAADRKKLTRQELVRERAELAQQGGGGRGGRGGGGGGGGGRVARRRRGLPQLLTGQHGVRLRADHNLYLVEVKGDTTPVKLSSDGVRNYSFGSRDTTTQNQQQQTGGRTGSAADEEQQGGGGGGSRDPRVRAQVTWSPDSKAFVASRAPTRAA